MSAENEHAAPDIDPGMLPLDLPQDRPRGRNELAVIAALEAIGNDELRYAPAQVHALTLARALDSAEARGRLSEVWHLSQRYQDILDRLGMVPAPEDTADSDLDALLESIKSA